MKIRLELVFSLFFVAVFLSVLALISSQKLIINITHSLPSTFYWSTPLSPDDELNYFDVVGYLPPDEAFNPFNAKFLKLIRGKPNDVISMQEINNEKVFFVNNQKLGVAKAKSKKGNPLEAGAVGVLPENQYFVWTPHEDSYDSRYKKMGWIQRSNILIRAKPIF